MTGVKGHKVNPHPDFETNNQLKRLAELRKEIIILQDNNANEVD